MNIRPILNIRPKYSPFRAFHVAVGSGCTIKHFSLACPTQHTIPSQYRPGALVYWPLAAKGMPTKLTCTHSYRVGAPVGLHPCVEVRLGGYGVRARARVGT